MTGQWLCPRDNIVFGKILLNIESRLYKKYSELHGKTTSVHFGWYASLYAGSRHCYLTMLKNPIEKNQQNHATQYLKKSYKHIWTGENDHDGIPHYGKS